MPAIYYNNKKVASNIVYCKNIFSKGTGLMLRSEKSVEDKAWLFDLKKNDRISVTMFMVFFPIDIIFLDERNTIVEIVENLRPFSHYKSSKKVFSFVELKCGTVNKHSMHLGKTLKIK